MLCNAIHSNINAFHSPLMAVHAFSPLDEGPSLLWRQLIYQDNCYERCKPSIDPLADTDRHHHYPIRSRFGLYRSLFNSSLSDKLGEPVSQVAFPLVCLASGWRSLRRSPASCRSALA
nr:Uncharacterised protein [Klebsiella pneumoniae]